MRVEVELVEEAGGLFRATAVAYPEVSITGRTEKEALSLIMEAVEKHLRKQAGGQRG